MAGFHKTRTTSIHLVLTAALQFGNAPAPPASSTASSPPTAAAATPVSSDDRASQRLRDL